MSPPNIPPTSRFQWVLLTALVFIYEALVSIYLHWCPAVAHCYVGGSPMPENMLPCTGLELYPFVRGLPSNARNLSSIYHTRAYADH
eukprot:scaffold6819_cov143-Skeletonema_dohrnii-CCMP3373.AAC.2